MSDDWKLPWRGGCRCGRVRFTVTEAPIMSMACHCKGCQSMTASAFSLSLMVPTSGLTLTRGETEPGGLQENLDHRFCGFCKTWMFTAFDRAVPFVNLRATMLDEHDWFVPFTESCTTEKLPWVTTPAKHRFPQFQPRDAWPALMAEFAAEGARPSG